MYGMNNLDNDQLACVRYINDAEDALICADVGTGKTVIALTAAEEALRRGTVTRWLVVAPLLVATDTWASEPHFWSHLRASVAVVCGTAEERLQALAQDADITVTNYENLTWLINHYKKGKKVTLPFDGLICDEVDKMKSVTTARFKGLRNHIHTFNKRIGLTGTLTPNDLLELWGQVYLVDGGQSFGRSFYKWREKFFYPIDFKQFKWVPLPGTQEKLLAQLQGFTFRLEAKHSPEVVVREPQPLEMPAATRGLYKELEKEFYVRFQDAVGKEHDIEAANSAVVSGKLMQMSAGFSYVGDNKEAVWHSKDKIDWVCSLAAALNDLGLQILIFYHFTEELEELKRRFKKLDYLGGGISNERKCESIRKWNDHAIPVMALHPASAGHGLNLQKSGAHHIAFLTMPWSGGMYTQVVGRLARRGQKAPQVFVHTAHFTDTIDKVVFEAVTGKVSRMKRFLDEIITA